MSLTIVDLHDVLVALQGASPKWFNFGLTLGLPFDFLSSLESEYPRDNDTCLRKMLTMLLNSRSDVTWHVLSDALWSPNVGLNHLAKNIAGN